MTDAHDGLAANLEVVHERLARACQRAGRRPDEVTLVSVSKTVDAARVRQAYDLGERDFGENYGQHLRDKAGELADLPDLRWHFIGPLQRNKVKYTTSRASLIHSIHNTSLLAEVDRRAAAAGWSQEVLVQLNLSGEQTKSGIDDEALAPLLDAFALCTHTRCVGLMTMPPFFDDPDAARPHFAALKNLLDRAATVQRPNVDLRHLSMGMSGDFEVAIEEGATLVRVGTAIFGARQY